MSGLANPRALLSERRAEIGDFLRWALDAELKGSSLRWRVRPDIEAARRAAEAFPEPWWGVVVYSCFMSEIGALAVAPFFQEPIDIQEAEEILASITLPCGAVQSHRIQSAGHSGAKIALGSACRHADAFREILIGPGSFHDRYSALGALRARQWGRTTRYDLVLRAGALCLGGHSYEPNNAYLRESTGPRKGFAAIFGVIVTPANADACEGVLREWSANWDDVAREAGVMWVGDAFAAGDFENALCVYQERGGPFR